MGIHKNFINSSFDDNRTSVTDLIEENRQLKKMIEEERFKFYINRHKETLNDLLEIWFHHTAIKADVFYNNSEHQVRLSLNNDFKNNKNLKYGNRI